LVNRCRLNRGASSYLRFFVVFLVALLVVFFAPRFFVAAIVTSFP
jgi:hypothetical protein